MSELAGLHIVVTGGAGALGRAVVEHLSVQGATCHAPRHDELDLTDEAAVTTYYQRLPPLWASVQVAGGYAGGPFAVTSLADFRRQMEMNLTTCFLCCREAVRSMGRRPGGPEGGRIINIGSRAALSPGGGAIAYSVSKAGVAALTQCLADEVKASRILVNAIIPSIIDTPANRQAMPGAAKAAGDRWPKPSAIAGAIAWLASPANQLVSGALLPVYGDT
ncbi:MAG TPA: SDR family NAD(P)-dependent oxidoreductase [Polyangia bacterium]|jgi:NAD(P)-dependent dehydrogenase (short-subunit alcohol dehydrogenase family)|nr:SDR family NAD(P)-dependent oxidoreductase [Polyangia bacterium]